jgi:hypothetical protein
VPRIDQHPERVQTEQLGGHRRRGQRSPPEPHIQPPVHQSLELLRHTGLDLVDLQIGVPLLDLVEDQWHRVVAGVDDPNPQTRGRTSGPLRGRRRPIDVGKDLPRLDQEGGAGRAQLHLVGRTLDQEHPKLAFQTFQLLAQRGLDDVLAYRRPAEVQLLGKGDEVAQLPKLHARHTPAQPLPWRRAAPVSLVVRMGHGPGPAVEITGRMTVPLIITGDQRCSFWPFRAQLPRALAGHGHTWPHMATATAGRGP